MSATSISLSHSPLLWLKALVCNYVPKYLSDSFHNLLRLSTILVGRPQLETLEQLAGFIVQEISVALKASLLITIGWMSLYFTNVHPIFAFLITACTLAYISRRWYKCDDQNLPNEFLLKLRLAKMLHSCICTLLCLLMFLLVSLNACENPKENEQPVHYSRTIFSSSFLKVHFELIFHNFCYYEIPVFIYLFALESVLLTDIVSNVLRMVRVNEDYKNALNFEGPIICQCTLKIIFGVFLYNIFNAYCQNSTLETILLVLAVVWSASCLIDVGFFRQKNPIPRRNDFIGYQKIHDISWFQVDVDIVAYSISILLYSQWKSAPNIVYPDEISSLRIMPPKIYSKPVSMIDDGWNGNTNTSLTSNRLSGDNSLILFTSEALFLLFMLMISFRFKINFMDSYKFTQIIRETRWLPEFVAVEQRLNRNFLRREIPFRWGIGEELPPQQNRVELGEWQDQGQ